MPLTHGTRLGVYEIISLLGSGGMGEVYRATDTVLKRQVALKVLPPDIAADPERIARFQREAEVLAALNHPNIAQLYGIETSDGSLGLVMELVEGPTLADRISLGPIPLDEALPIARQIAEALEAAHEQGIIHRDLKPANIKVREDGTVKVLDFGMAKVLEPMDTSGSGALVSNSPTITSPALMTGVGVLLGTAAYMSPEQAKGRSADKRSDVWAFGCVLYEILTARRAFDGEDIAGVLSAVIRAEPEWDRLPPATPPSLVALIRHSLVKNPRERIGDIAAARFALALGADPRQENVSGHGRRVWPIALGWGVAALAVLVGVAVWALRPTTVPTRLTLEVKTAPTQGFNSFFMLALSPDGRDLVARVPDKGVNKLWRRSLADLGGTFLPGSENATLPFWSPDGRRIGFFAGSKLKTLDIDGGEPQVLADTEYTYGGTWNSTGTILYAAQRSGPIYEVPASGGGQPVPATELNAARFETSHLFPRFLPDGRHFVYLVQSSKPEFTGIYLSSLGSRTSVRLTYATAKPDFAAPDLLLFLRESNLMAQRLDVSAGALLGEPTKVAEGVAWNGTNGMAAFTSSDTNVLAFRPGGGGLSRDLRWFDRGGAPGTSVNVPGLYDNLRFSPNGKRVAAFDGVDSSDIWIFDLDRNGRTRFTFDPAVDNDPVWSPDGSRIAFVSNRDGGVFNIYQKDASGSGDDQVLLKTDHNKHLNDWSKDGRFLLYQEESTDMANDLWLLPLFGDRKPVAFLRTRFNEWQGTFSPDGRHIAYASDEAGGLDVFIRPFPQAPGKVQVSTTTGAHPVWRGDGKELYFDSTGVLNAVEVTEGPGGALQLSSPRSLLSGLQNLPGPHNFDVLSDGSRFLVAALPSLPSVESPIVVMVNWPLVQLSR